MNPIYEINQLSLFDESPTISRISCENMEYEVGEKGVGSINLTEHGSETTDIYKVCDTAGELIVFAGLLKPHDIEFGGWNL